ncbi:VOC family protein [Starkeya koreensis]|uniref:VOC family protein n=1 Tax=Ancylobacter koreensis TaxID=266121 RepID=A0ABT0DHQ3_9HYPH|nr:VOC family protein [Ancylobacter koreensis]MCK0206815.1 VOC family protein [Ancylobacter koreensis]
MLKLDHLTVIAPSLAEGVAHVRACLGIEVPFGMRHLYMGTHNHRLRLGEQVYLEIVALDPEGIDPGRPRWFGLDDHAQVRADWEEGRRLRGWVAGTEAMDASLDLARGPAGSLFGEKIALPQDEPSFAFSIPADGSLPLDGAVPSLIDHRGDAGYIASIPDLGAQLHALVLEHPDPDGIGALYRRLEIDRPPAIVHGPKVHYRALIETADGLRELT